MFPSRLVSVLGKGALPNNYSLEFDGSNDYVSMGTSHGFPIGNADRSMSGWVSTTETGSYKPLFGYGNIVSVATNKLFVIMNSGNKGYFAGHGNEVDSEIVINDGAWHHIAVTHDGGVLTAVYVDSVLGANSGSKTLATPADTNFYIMKYPGGSDIATGLIDEVAIWDVALTAGDISTIYNNGVPTDLLSDSNAGSLQGWWRFEEGSGTSAIDSSTNSNVGTLTNGPVYSTDTP